MGKIHTNIAVGIDEDIEEQLQWLSPNYENYHILKKSVDARKRGSLKFIYSIETFQKGEPSKKEPIRLKPLGKYNAKPVVIIGAGPAGLFAALRLLERGIPCILLEQGEETKKRVLSISKYWRKGILNENSNVGFGEGGAGLFSDGKLITRIKSDHIPYVMQRLVQFGAPEEIEYLSNPHVGSDKIRRVIPKLREHILSLGGEIHFNTQVTKINFSQKSVTGVTTKNVVDDTFKNFETDHIILATGHSSKIFDHLHENDVFMEGKSFAVGLRIEHNQELINKIQYKEFSDHPKLGAANYKLAYTNKDHGVGVYSFCMCPGGYVLSSGTEQGHLVSNGMSNYNRNSKFANAAMVLSIDHQKTFGDDLMGGMKFRASLEAQAFKMVQKNQGTKELPAQYLSDFLSKKISSSLHKTSSPSGAVSSPLHELFDNKFHSRFSDAIEVFNKRMRGFSNDETILFGVESRTSCPVRITRDNKTLESISHKGLYPTGEGAGYAGGITSAACDGVKVADQIYSLFKPTP
ncbi:MAG: NAD(P)/FAD-dependent oxidoreductase [Bdellovibrionales bacterium]